MRLEHIRRRLAAFRRQPIDEPKVARAAVALILAETAAGVELLFIQRAIRDDDPWSGHMAFPGGRRDPGDRDAVATAVRETHEEVGIDLGAAAEVIGHLDELRAVARRRPLDLVIAPVVFALRRPVVVRPSPREVESAVWVPLPFFATAAARATHARTFDGVASEFPAYRFQHYTIWGLTHRILDGFLEIVAADGPAPA